MKRYSQGREQDIAIAHFGGARGVFLSLGENDGETFSNVRALALLGWQGVCVEPSPAAFARLSALYAGNTLVECHNVGLCEGNGAAILHESGAHVGRHDVALLSTARPEEMERWRFTGAQFTPTEMECVTFQELLKRSEHAHFDFITIDIEGLDYEVLTQIDLTAVGCKMLIVEVNDRDPQPYIDYCRGHGMELSTRNSENLIFVWRVAFHPHIAT